MGSRGLGCMGIQGLGVYRGQNGGREHAGARMEGGARTSWVQNGGAGSTGPEWGWEGRLGAAKGARKKVGAQGPGGRLKLRKIVISKHPLGTVWHETILTSHQSGILHSLIFELLTKFKWSIFHNLLNG